MTDTALFTGEEHVTATMDEYKTRLAAVKARIDAYSADCMRRYATDEYHAASARIRGASQFIAGE